MVTDPKETTLLQLLFLCLETDIGYDAIYYKRHIFTDE